MKHPFRVLAVGTLALTSLLAVGCDSDGDSGAAAPSFETARSALSRDTAPAVGANDLAKQVTGNTRLALALYQQLRPKNVGKNLIFSPHSISTALAMTHAGAAGDTATQMANALHFDVSGETLHKAFGALELAFESRGKGAQGVDGQPFRLTVVNAIWGQTGKAWEATFLDTLAVWYGAGLNLLDFAQAPEEGRTTINAWVSQQTAGLIPKLLPEGSITPLTRLVLTNAIYFNARWLHTFSETGTAPRTWNLADGATASVDTMQQTEQLPYADGQGWIAVELPYDGDEVAMLVIVPDAGTFETFDAGLGEQHFTAAVGALATTNITLRFPKFDFGTDAGLNDILKALGMTDAFDASKADFSGMDGSRELFITDVVHKAVIKLDERGTEAAAATGVVAGTTSAPPPPIDVHVDRPFIFAIRDKATSALIFVGRVLDPRQTP